MVKRKVSEDESSVDSPTSLDGADYTDRGWTTTRGNDWHSVTYAFGLSTSRRRRRGRRGRAGSRGGVSPTGSGGEEESDIMKELLEIVLWNGEEKEIDITAELTDEEEDSDDEEMACMKRLMMAREQTIRPSAVGEKKKEERGVGGGGKGVKVPSGPLSVSNLRFDSLLKIGSKREGSQKTSITRLEQRTTTMERAFKGEFDDGKSAKSSSRAELKTSTSTTIEGGGEGNEENFWDDVEF